MFIKYGGTLRDGTVVTGITPGDILTLTTSTATYRTKKLIITAGPWTPKLIKPLGIHVPLKVGKTVFLLSHSSSKQDNFYYQFS